MGLFDLSKRLSWLVIASAMTILAQPLSVIADKLQLCLPPTIYAVPGIETNIYFDNILLALNLKNYSIDVHCELGIQQTERWTLVPTDKNVGIHSFSIEVRNSDYQVVAKGQSEIVISPTTSGAGRKLTVLFVGDSLTHDSTYPKHILDLCSGADEPQLKLIGSFEPDGIRGFGKHEGYGGWTAKRFATHYAEPARQGPYLERGSPFLYKSSSQDQPKLDFARYCEDVNNGQFPDIVTIFLGPNDIYADDENSITLTINGIVTAYDQLFKMIHKDSPNTLIGIMLPVPPTQSQDAFGNNSGSGQTRWQYRRNQHRLVMRLTDQYNNRGDENIFIIPTYANLDCLHNYPAKESPWNARTQTTTMRQNNSVHPSAEGYYQIGDTVYCWLKAQLNQ